ncbi:DUF4336 domain-containing protein [Pseudoalteromonas xiamenensis]|uniref:DUF4336 domain-containing protein n=1 Tax=Pseudoalteromonas xiamenensis TaxID=882626 RepID=A0A975HMZ9_9GAMM|nr:DUF4336 domain-containing protein [Pseudoalteromonas xiamenensis]QTH73646.1 DUF4336 domain-containing protein [Pseudoalteromonas xiamenensis]
MKSIGEHIWIVDGSTVQFFTMPFTTRMTIVKLSNGDLWIHSPIELNPQLKQQVDSLGAVRYLIAPNHLHHLFMKQWQDAYPEALSFGTEEVLKKRSDLSFTGPLEKLTETPWAKEIDSHLFTGSPAMEECVFFHKPSQTLIVTDLIENFSPKAFGSFKRFMASLVGVLAPHGKMPLDWRLTFTFHKKEAKKHIEHIIAWQPMTIVMAHGVIITENAVDFLMESFDWLEPSIAKAEQLN